MDLDILIISGVPDLSAALVQGASHRAGAKCEVCPLEDDVATAVRQVRRRFGGPLGVVLVREFDELLALEHGADETVTAERLERGAGIQAFYDRVELRARLRRQVEQRSELYVHGEKLAALGTLVAGVGHEINNPLTAIMLSLEIARQTVTRLRGSASTLEIAARARPELASLASELSVEAFSEVISSYDEMDIGIGAVARVVRDLHTFVQTDYREPVESFYASEVVDQALRLAGHRITRVSTIECDFPKDEPLVVLPKARLMQVLINILVNAAQAVQEVDRVRARVRITIRFDEEFLAISVADNGPGISSAALLRIFDPFFTTKRATQGTGLGLAISRSLLRAFGGDLIVESVFGEGATFICLLPRTTAVSSVSDDAPESGRTTAPPAKPVSVLLVDEDDRVLRAAAARLGTEFRVVIARDSQEAQDLLLSGTRADVIVYQIDLPVIDGPEFVAWLAKEERGFATTVLFTTHSALKSEHQTFVDAHHIEAIAKPIRGEMLFRAIRRALEVRELTAKGARTAS